MKGQVLKRTYRFYSSVPLSTPIKMNLIVTFILFADFQCHSISKTIMDTLFSNEMHIRMFWCCCVVVFVVFCLFVFLLSSSI